ncbi:MAG: tetratricopeptide repeat protein [Rhodothermales bacterium]|nr:tetratricopeptide repeat protein [Rhodothermales bacterium]
MRQIRLWMVVSMLFVSAGCNVFEPFYSEGASDDPEVLLDDARYALQNGDPDKAVTFLEKAYEIDSTNTEVRVELASALFQANGIDLLMMKDLAEFITEQSDDTGAFAGKHPVDPLVCSFVGSSADYQALQFDTEPAYLTIIEHGAVIDRVAALIEGIADTGEDLGANAQANRQMTRAIANLSVAIKLITRAAEQAGGGIYPLRNGIGYCAPDQLTLQALQATIICDAVPYLNRAVQALGARQAILSSDDTEFVELVQDVRDDLTASITATCGIDVRITG